MHTPTAPSLMLARHMHCLQTLLCNVFQHLASRAMVLHTSRYFRATEWVVAPSACAARHAMRVPDPAANTPVVHDYMYIVICLVQRD